jgi:hypothetical protein
MGILIFVFSREVCQLRDQPYQSSHCIFLSAEYGSVKLLSQVLSIRVMLEIRVETTS